MERNPVVPRGASSAMMLMNSLKGHIRAVILIFDFRTTKIKFWEGLFSALNVDSKVSQLLFLLL